MVQTTFKAWTAVDRDDHVSAGVAARYGAFCQCFKRDLAVYCALRSYRVQNPSSPIHLIADGGDDLRDLAALFHCRYVYETTNIGRIRSPDATISQYIWLKRLYDACITTFEAVNWIVLLETDVECLRAPKHVPQYVLSGGRHGPQWSPLLRGMFFRKVGTRVRNNGLGCNYIGCGGSVFHKDIFCECMERTEYKVFEDANRLDNRVLSATDATLCFLFQVNGFDTGPWEDYGRFNDSDREKRAFVHGDKRYYNKPIIL